MIDETRLKILTESAKYDVSCSSSGSKRANVKGGIGNACFSGICHSFTQDGRCISLLKILLSNDCAYDCKYCINRRSNSVMRATATAEEISELVIGFYKRNYIEGLFLSSAIIKNPEYTMEQLYKTVFLLRTKYRFNGYIHVKGIPGADETLLIETGKLSDRMSFNIELPSEQSLKLLAPQKNKNAIITPIKDLAIKRYYLKKSENNENFLPAGQTTQMIIGASPETDAHVLKLSEFMYNNYRLKRVYYSSYIPTNFETDLLPYFPVPKMREHRLYQADWLLRFYGFNADEITGNDGNLPLELDPKCAWALRNLGLFPVEINTAPVEMLLRVPGIGMQSAGKIASARKYAKLDFDDLKKLRVVLKRAKHFITCMGKFIGDKNQYGLKNLLSIPESTIKYTQTSMFEGSGFDLSPFAINGEL